MSLKNLFNSLLTKQAQGPLVRVDGTLSGDAMREEGMLGSLGEAVAAVSAQRPYCYDLDLSSGRFSVILVEAVLPLSAFHPDPETAVAQDLQNMLEALPPQHRTSVDSTFRALWHEGGEVAGVAFRVEPPGRIAAEKRIRPEQEYDRLEKEQAEHGYVAPAGSILPRWVSLLVAALIFVGGSYLVYQWYQQTPVKMLEAVMVEGMDLDGFEGLFTLEEPRVESERIIFTLVPTGQPEIEDPDPLQKLAAEALVKGRANLDIFDHAGALLLTVPIDLEGFDGTAAVQVRTMVIRLPVPPAAVKIRP